MVQLFNAHVLHLKAMKNAHVTKQVVHGYENYYQFNMQLTENVHFVTGRQH